MRASILDTRVMRGADVYSDHYLVRTRIRMKLAKAHGKNKARVRFDVCKPRSEEIRRRYNIEVKNRFQGLGDIEDSEEEHNKILVTYRDAAEKVIGRSKKQSKLWIGDNTWGKFRRGEKQGRPIVSACRCPTELISSYLDKIMAPIVKTLPSYMKDSHLVLKIFRDFNFLGQNNHYGYYISLYCYSQWQRSPGHGKNSQEFPIIGSKT